MQVVPWVLGAALAMLAAERLWPARPLPEVPGWWPRALLLNAAQAAAVLLAGLTWDPWLRSHRLVSAEPLGIAGGALLGYFATTFVYYWWHRARHASPLLWRWIHQVHHSPERLEVATSFYKHPFELLANALLSSALLYLALGLGPEAAALAVLIAGLAELFYHWNVRTPHALGPFFQRPEMHRVHHRAGLHRYNYSDLPLWDLLFGTYHNPRCADEPCGLGPGVERRLGALLRGRDLTPRDATPRLPAPAPRAGHFTTHAAPALLLALGLSQMAAAALDLPLLRGVAAATGAAPAPKVFTTVLGLETFSSRFVLELEGHDGSRTLLPLTPERYASLRGPYARRNAYGAAVAYGPVLAADPRTAPLLAAVTRYGLCGEAPLLRELGVDPRAVRSAHLRVAPRPGSAPDPALPLVLEASCS